MDIARRGLLGLGAAAAAGALTSCLDAPAPPVNSDSAAPAGGRGASDSVRRRLGGSVQRGLYYGASIPYGRSVTAFESDVGSPLSLHRSYFTSDENEAERLLGQCRQDVRIRRLPHVSVKPIWSWADIAAGRYDDWFRPLLWELSRLSSPIFFTLHHEPENDVSGAGRQPADYLRMQRRLLTLASDEAPQVLVVPVLQHWTFDPIRTDVDPAEWLLPEAGVAGLDIYNPWSATNGKEWRSFASKVDEVLDWFDGMPLVIGEYGCRADPDDPERAAGWLRDAASYARTHDIVAMSYFNSAVGTTEGTWELQGTAKREFGDLLASEWVARID